MKIISWNLRRLGRGKLRNKFSPKIGNMTVSGDVGSYIVQVVIGGGAWGTTGFGTPADIFVIIELVSGGTKKGSASYGTCELAIKELVDALNKAAQTQNLQNSYHYAGINSQITGYHECVGIVYNDALLTLTNAEVLRDTSSSYLLPRTPLWARFTEKTAAHNIVALHAPPPGGGDDTRFREPINFCRQLAMVNQVAKVTGETTYVLGDFNCSPTASFIMNKRAGVGKGPSAQTVQGFIQLFQACQYGALLPPFTPPTFPDPGPPAADALSSVRRSLDTGYVPPADYLSDAYDNILFRFAAPAPTPKVRVLDLIGSSPAYPGSVKDLLNNYNKVSDHLPVVLEY